MQKIWFIVIDGKKYGPFSVEELRSLSAFTPDTLVWREGFPKPLPARDVPELKSLFEDSEELKPPEGKKEKSFPKVPYSDELAIDMRSLPPSLFVFLFFLILLILIMFLLKNNP